MTSDVSPPPIHRAIFAHSDAAGWRDNPGFNAYFLRAAFPSLTVEVQRDWEDRIAATSGKGSPDRAWHFPILLLADRTAAHHGAICSQLRRTASEPWEFMKNNNQLVGERVGVWWDPIRRAIWQFSGAALQSVSTARGTNKVVITYISRQSTKRRKLVEDDHNGLVTALERLVEAKGPSWEFNVLIAEKMSKDEQIKAIARTTVRRVDIHNLAGVLCNCLSRSFSVFMEMD